MRISNIHWTPTLFILGYHLFLLIALPLYFIHGLPSIGLIWATIALVFASALAVTAGYHRLYSHQTYKVNPIAEAVLLFFASVGTHGSALRWCYNHRLHHAFVDTEKDPYSIKKGFWYAHMLWMFEKSDEIEPKVVSDLMRNKMVVFQHKYYGLCMLVSNALMFLAVGWLVGDYWGSLIFAWFLRAFIMHHTTWSINSFAHKWGTQNYSKEHSAVDSYIVCLLTYGEGYHNYHHTFAHDYRNGIRWYHFDPTKWLIWTLSKLGLASDLRRVSDFRISRQLISEHKEKLKDALKRSLNLGLEKKVSEIGDALLEKLAVLQSLYDKYKTIPKRETRALRDQIRSTKKEWKNTWKQWRKITKLAHLVEPTLRAH